MIKACLNGDRHPRSHPRLPVTPAQLAAAALAAAEAGASMVHVHPRDERGLESLVSAHIVEAVRAIRAEAPGVPISVSTRAGIEPNVRTRLSLVSEWPSPDDGGPDCASVNWHEDGAVEVARLLRARGIGVEAGLWTPRSATAFVSTNWPWQVDRVLVEVIPGTTPGSDGGWAAERILAAMGMVPAHVVVHGEQAWAWPVLRWAQAAGYSVRIGLEDTLCLPTGREAYDNAELVAAAREQVPGSSSGWPIPDPL